MRALTLSRDRVLALSELAEPVPDGDELLVQTIAVGICGTDRRLVSGGWWREGEPERLILGHEVLGKVLSSPKGSGFAVGDLVGAMVRRPDPLPCHFCGSGRPDLCENGGYTERGISIDGFAAERYTIEARHAVPVDAGLGLAGVLLEPTSVVVKAWERLDQLAGRRRQRALVLGAGPIGLLAALLGRQRDHEVHVVDQVAGGPKPRQVARLGAEYHRGADELDGSFDLVLECSGALVSEAVRQAGSSGSICLLSGSRDTVEPIPSMVELAHQLIISNRTLTGIVNSSRAHFEAAHQALLQAPRDWLSALLVPMVPLEAYQAAFAASDGGSIKAVVRFPAQ